MRLAQRLEKEERQKKVRPSEDEDVMEETLQIFYCSRTVRRSTCQERMAHF